MVYRNHTVRPLAGGPVKRADELGWYRGDDPAPILGAVFVFLQHLCQYLLYCGAAAGCFAAWWCKWLLQCGFRLL